MKKNLKHLIPAVAFSLMMGGCGQHILDESTPASFATAFPNGNNAGAINLTTTEADMSGYQFLEDEDPAFEEITIEESCRLVEEQGTGVVLYSYTDCPYCNRAVPLLNQAAEEEGVTIFYVDVHNEEFEAKSEEEQTEIINHLYTVMASALAQITDEDTGETGVELQVPLVVSIKDGEIVDHHLGLVDSFTLDEDDPDSFQLTQDQQDELLMIYSGLIEEAYY
jgi:glutaredoxin